MVVKMGNKVGIVAAVIALVIGFLGFSSWFLLGKDSGYYYVQIDNSKIEEGDSRDGVVDLRGGMDYYYTLPAYDENGRERSITFGASRQLREGAYLRLTVKPIRGVTEWNEVEYKEMPQAVQGRFSPAPPLLTGCFLVCFSIKDLLLFR